MRISNTHRTSDKATRSFHKGEDILAENLSNMYWVYYGSGNGVRCCICVGRTLHVHSADGSTLQEMTSRPPSAAYVMSKFWLRQSIDIYLMNNPAKFHPDLIWNDGALGFF